MGDVVFDKQLTARGAEGRINPLLDQASDSRQPGVVSVGDRWTCAGGPGIRVSRKRVGYVIKNAGGEEVGMAFSRVTRSQPEAEAIGGLMAAAPELLEALTRLCNLMLDEPRKALALNRADVKAALLASVDVILKVHVSRRRAIMVPDPRAGASAEIRSLEGHAHHTNR